MTMPTQTMPPKIVDLAYLRLQIEPDLSLISLFWKRQVTNSELRTGFYTAVEVARSYKCRFWLGDARQTTMLNIADQDYLVKDLVSLISNSGIKKVARIVTEDEYDFKTSFSMKLKIETNHSASIGFETNIFTDHDAAKKWLFA